MSAMKWQNLHTSSRIWLNSSQLNHDSTLPYATWFQTEITHRRKGCVELELYKSVSLGDLLEELTPPGLLTKSQSRFYSKNEQNSFLILRRSTISCNHGLYECSPISCGCTLLFVCFLVCYADVSTKDLKALLSIEFILNKIRSYFILVGQYMLYKISSSFGTYHGGLFSFCFEVKC